MAIDPSIAMGYRGLGEMPNPMNQLAQVSQIQSSQRQGEMAQMQLAKMRRDEQGLAEYSRKVAAMGGPSDPIEIAKAYLAHPDVEMQKFGANLFQKALAVAGYKALSPDIAAAAPTVEGAPAGQTNALIPAGGTAPIGQTNALLSTVGAAPPASTATVESRLAEIRVKLARLEPFTGANGAPGAIREADMLKLEAGELLKSRNVAQGNTLVRPGLPNFTAPLAVTPEKAPTPPAMVAEYTFAKTPDGGSYKGSFADFKRLNRPAASAGAGGASTGKPLTALQERKAKETEVAQRSVVKSADTAATELETLADTLLGNPSKKIQPHPGLGGITGFMSVLPSMPESEARSAQQKLDTFKGKVMAFGRLLAVQQGKLGNMAVSEWKFISDAIEKIDPAANNFNDQLRDVVRQAKDFAAAKRETFDELYDSTTPPNAPTKPSAATPAGAAPNTPQLDIRSRADAIIKGNP